MMFVLSIFLFQLNVLQMNLRTIRHQSSSAHFKTVNFFR